MSDIVYRYLPEKNPDARAIAGTPLRDLTADDLAYYPPHQIRDIAACPFYKQVEASPTPPARRGFSLKAEEGEEENGETADDGKKKGKK